MNYTLKMLVGLFALTSCAENKGTNDNLSYNSVTAFPTDTTNFIVEEGAISKSEKEEYLEAQRKWLEDKILITDSLLMDNAGNLYLCGQYAAYATGDLIRFEPRIDDYVIELKYLIDTSTFRILEYPVFRDKTYFYSFNEMSEGGTVSVFEANEDNELKFEMLIDSLKQKKNVR
jgi:hypothetical protein